jgi:hypothetical protein
VNGFTRRTQSFKNEIVVAPSLLAHREKRIATDT